MGYMLGVWPLLHHRSILLSPLKTSFTSTSSVPALLLPSLSLSSNASAAKPNILPATLSAASLYWPSLCMPSANSSMVNSRLTEMCWRREDVEDAISGFRWEASVCRISACSGSRNEGSMSEGVGSVSVGIGGTSGAPGGFRSSSHVARSSCNLGTGRKHLHWYAFKNERTYRLICASRSCILAALEMFFGFGFFTTTAGAVSSYERVSGATISDRRWPREVPY